MPLEQRKRVALHIKYNQGNRMKKGNILIVDDNKSVLTALELLLQPVFSKVITSSTPNQIVSLMREYRFDAIVLDMNYSSGINTGNEGLYWLKRILEINPESSVIMITAYGDVELAVKAVKEGAIDFILKPWENSKLLATINSAVKLTQSRKEVKQLKLKEQNLRSELNKEWKEIIGSSPALLETLDIVKKVAKTNANILITGENGTGKELIAQELYRLSDRNKEVFVSVDMGSLTETLFESELFGHKKGAFTDAKEDRIGKFEVAEGGTLFLDEIANIPLPLQAKLLTVLQQREVVRVGANEKIPIDIRLICATNANLFERVEQGLFREDLLYRINTIQIEVPPLRERIEDIATLTNFFLKKYGNKYDKQGLKINAQALEKLEKYSWPGNVRELQHTVEKVVILSDKEILNASDFFLSNSLKDTTDEDSTETLEMMEQRVISNCLEKNDNNLTITAQQLGITRQTLYNKIKKYNL